MRIWLDDVRSMPPSFDLHVKTSAEAMKLVLAGKITLISLDHDLGGDDTGYAVTCCIEAAAYAGKIPRMAWTIHSANPVGRDRMTAAMLRAEFFWEPDHCVHCDIWLRPKGQFQGAGDGRGRKFACYPECEKPY